MVQSSSTSALISSDASFKILKYLMTAPASCSRLTILAVVPSGSIKVVDRNMQVQQGFANEGQLPHTQLRTLVRVHAVMRTKMKCRGSLLFK